MAIFSWVRNSSFLTFWPLITLERTPFWKVFFGMIFKGPLKIFRHFSRDAMKRWSQYSTYVDFWPFDLYLHKKGDLFWIVLFCMTLKGLLKIFGHFSSSFIPWCMSYASYRVEGALFRTPNKNRSHTLQFSQLQEQKTKNPVTCIDSYDSPDQFEYQWAIVLYKRSCQNGKKPDKGA